MFQLVGSSTTGFPRIGPHRELKFALERYWKGAINENALMDEAANVEREAWTDQLRAGIDLVGIDGTLYDHVLDWVYYLGLAPERFSDLRGLDQYFAMARGAPGAPALDMSKYFDTNYHYMVPELTDASIPSPNFKPFFDKVLRAQEVVGKERAVPIVLGPITLLRLSTTALPLAILLPRLLPAYQALLTHLRTALAVPEVQIHEPALTLPDAPSLAPLFSTAYTTLAPCSPPINLVVPYDDLASCYPWVVTLPVAAITLDFLGVPGTTGPQTPSHPNTAASHGPATTPPSAPQIGKATIALITAHGFPVTKRLGAGVVCGRSPYADDPAACRLLLDALDAAGVTSPVMIHSSVSLQHLPYDTTLEPSLPPALVPRLAFARQKLATMALLATGPPAPPPVPRFYPSGNIWPTYVPECFPQSFPSAAPPPEAPPSDDIQLDAALFVRSAQYEERRGAQVVTRAFPTSTIGSFPQTAELRRVRQQWKRGDISEGEYLGEVDAYIAKAVEIQEELDLDVLVHGEPERTDMVEYFGQKLEGMCFTQHGWVQSYGSRCVRPPIIHADIRRTAAMTIREFQVAQALTSRPMKGMLTGPVTILNWSFPRKDVSRRVQALQLGLALRGEVADLEAVGCRVIQVDDPALREGLPLKAERRDAYLTWAVDAFRLCTAVAKPQTQIVTHLCYSDFGDIMHAVDRMDADVLTIENSRSGDATIRALAAYGYSRDIGAGVYDVHSPLVPSVDSMARKLATLCAAGVHYPHHPERIWVVPDCGLKTRAWEEVVPSLRNMAAAAAGLRAALVMAAGVARQQEVRAAR